MNNYLIFDEIPKCLLNGYMRICDECSPISMEVELKSGDKVYVDLPCSEQNFLLWLEINNYKYAT